MPARSSTIRTAAITPSDWSPGVVGTLPVKRPAVQQSTASVNVPPTSTPSEQRAAVSEDAALTAPRIYRLGGKVHELQVLERLDQVLVGGAVVAAGQRLALARLALARHRVAAARDAAGVVCVVGHLREQPQRELDVAV